MLREILPLIYQGRETGRRSFETEQQAAEYLSVAYLTDKGRYLGPGSHMSPDKFSTLIFSAKNLQPQPEI